MLETNRIINGDCIEVLKTLPDNSVDAIITDPPYGLGFMGKEWDTFDRTQFGKAGEEGENDLKVKKNFKILPRIAEGGELQKFTYEWAKECFRVLKSGGHILSFGGTRTYHRMATAIEDAGFEIRDMINWIYGSGFPKSLNIGKAIDKLQGNEREIIGTKKCPNGKEFPTGYEIKNTAVPFQRSNGINSVGTSEWEGWGTALKPAHEPIVLARKPLTEKTVALNVLKYGTGGINIDKSRIPTNNEDISGISSSSIWSEGNTAKNVLSDGNPLGGRFPANIIHDGSEVVINNFPDVEDDDVHDDKKHIQLTLFNEQIEENIINSSRFFYCAKASKDERDKGCEEMPDKDGGHYAQDEYSRNHMGNTPDAKRLPVKNNHPTVKPVALIEYLIKLITPPDGIVLDPFLGSGTTAVACTRLGFKYIGIEKEKEYCDIAEARIAHQKKQKKLGEYYAEHN